MKVIVNLLVNTASSCRWSTSLGHNLLVKWVATETAFYPPELHLLVNVIELHRTVPDLGIHCRAISGFPSIIMIMLLNHEHARIHWHWLNVGFSISSQSMWKSNLLTQLCVLFILVWASNITRLHVHQQQYMYFSSTTVTKSLLVMWF